jgi:hypothetical protein
MLLAVLSDLLQDTLWSLRVDSTILVLTVIHALERVNDEESPTRWGHESPNRLRIRDGRTHAQ